MEQFTLPAAAVPAGLAELIRASETQAALLAVALDEDGQLVLQHLPGVDPLAIPRVLKNMVQYEEVLRRLA
jgi:hypothetical protein